MIWDNGEFCPVDDDEKYRLIIEPGLNEPRYAFAYDGIPYRLIRGDLMAHCRENNCDLDHLTRGWEFVVERRANFRDYRNFRLLGRPCPRYMVDFEKTGQLIVACRKAGFKDLADEHRMIKEGLASCDL